MVRLATIGTSSITRTLATAVAATDGIRITVVHSRDPERAAALATDLGAPESSSDLVAMLAREDVDAVYIASPNSLHAQHALAAIEAGKHVLLEKPAVPTATEWAELVGHANAAGVVLLEAMRTEYDPGLQAVRELLPQVGRLRRVSFRYGQRSSRYDNVLAGERVNIFDPAMAGGALYDLGVYCIHPLISLFGEPSRVVGESVLLDTGADGAGVALAVYPDFIADLAYSKITSSELPSELQGEDATLTIDQIASPRLLRLTHRDGQVTEHQVTGPPQHGLHGEVAHFVRLIEAGESAARDQALTLQTLRVIDHLRTARV